MVDQGLTRLDDRLFVSIKLLSQITRMKVEVSLAQRLFRLCQAKQIVPVLDVIQNNSTLKVFDVYRIWQTVDQRGQQVALFVQGCFGLLTLRNIMKIESNAPHTRVIK